MSASYTFNGPENCCQATVDLRGRNLPTYQQVNEVVQSVNDHVGGAWVQAVAEQIADTWPVAVDVTWTKSWPRGEERHATSRYAVPAAPPAPVLTYEPSPPSRRRLWPFR